MKEFHQFAAGQTQDFSQRKLRETEALFLQKHPGGFQHTDMQVIGKKHNVEKLADFAGSVLTRQAFTDQGQVLDDIIRIVSRSSMVSMFEKPKFRDYVRGLSREKRAYLAGGYRHLLHGNQEQGFNAILDVLGEAKLAKWSLMTVCLFYHCPQREVFVKPTTTKNIIRRFELENLIYHPYPTWAFYRKYRTVIGKMKKLVNPSLTPNNAAFTGFLMMAGAADQKHLRT